MAAAAIGKVLGRSAVAVTGVAGIAVACTAFAQTQTETTPPKLTFNLSATLSGDSNRSLSTSDPDPGLRFDTSLGFRFDTRTRVDELQIFGNSLVRLGTKTTNIQTGSGLQEPKLTFAYARDTGNAKLSLLASYALSDVNRFEAQTLPDGSLSTNVPVTGTVTDAYVEGFIQTGINDPISFILSGNANRRNYSATTDTGVYDSRREALAFITRFTPSAVTRIDLNLRKSSETDDNESGTRRQSQSAGVGINRALSPILTLETEIGYDRSTSEQTFFGLPFTQRSDGVFGQAGLSVVRPNGTASVTLVADRDSEGLRNSLLFGRAFELPGGDSFDGDLGVSARPGGSTELVGNVRYTKPLPTGQLEASFDRSVSLNANDVDVTSSLFALSYQHEISAVSDIIVRADYSKTSSGGTGIQDATARQSLRASYSHDLTEAWSLETGYQYRHLKNEGSGTASSNSVFLTIGRTFVALR